MFKCHLIWLNNYFFFISLPSIPSRLWLWVPDSNSRSLIFWYWYPITSQSDRKWHETEEKEKKKLMEANQQNATNCSVLGNEIKVNYTVFILPNRLHCNYENLMRGTFAFYLVIFTQSDGKEKRECHWNEALCTIYNSIVRHQMEWNGMDGLEIRSDVRSI